MRLLAHCLVFVPLLSCGDVLAATSVTSFRPRSCNPGGTTRLTVSGKDLGGRLRVVTSNAEVDIRVESNESDKAILALSLPENLPLGPIGVWITTGQGIAEPIILVVDDLPAVADNGNNHLLETAQEIDTFVSVDGTSDGAKSDFYRFRVSAGQRVAFEVLSQEIESTMDPLVRLLDAGGKQLFRVDDDEIGPDGRFDYHFEQAGEYFLEVRDSRYAAGGNYYLRVGDFPILSHGFPLAIARGAETPINFTGEDGAEAEQVHVEIPADFHPDWTVVSTRFAEGQSSAWVPIRVCDASPRIESSESKEQKESEDGPFTLPLAISGKLSAPGEHDSYRITGITESTIRIESRTRSLRSATLLRMKLFNPKGVKVAETEVSDQDEWSLTYTFPDDGVYRLEVSDLLGRGGEMFGYFIEAFPADRFSIALKSDAKTGERFSIETGVGACAVDLQLDRSTYEGAIELSLRGQADGLKLVNPLVPAKAKEFRLYVAATEKWKEDSLAKIGLLAKATSKPELQCSVNSLALHRLMKPHVPFPGGWRDGVLVLGGDDAGESAWALESSEPIQFARPVATHSATLQLKRTSETFKGGVTVLPTSLPNGWRLATKVDKDVYQLTFTTAGRDPEQPEQLSLAVYGEVNGRGRISTTELPVEWFDPLRVSVEVAGPIIAGSSAVAVATIQRQGSDPQALTLTFNTASGGLSFPESISLKPDQQRVEFTIEAAADAVPQQVPVRFTAASKFRGTDFQIAGSVAPIRLIPIPERIEVYPPAIQLAGAKERRQLIVTGFHEGQSTRDWTRDASIISSNTEVAEVHGSVVFPKAIGETEVVVQIGEHRQNIPVRVTGMESNRRTEFESEVLVALSKQGCNSGACHGSPSGKGMFRLSLRAFDRPLDELTLIREEAQRRVNRIDPENSLLLLKPLMKVSHGGGKRLHEEDEAYAILRDWISEGASVDPPDTPRCIRLEVYPNAKRVLQLGSGAQQLSVTAHFADGKTRDVTHLVAYESSSTSVATVDSGGLVTPHDRGEAVILVRFLEHIESAPLMFVEKHANFTWTSPPEQNYIDRLVHAKLRQLQFLPSETCSDSEFLRRVYLDVIGILPTVAESKAFLSDSAEDKRAQLIDRLLEREEYAKFWALKWGDLLKMTSKSVGRDGVHKYYRWVEAALADNMPYDQFAHQLVTASGSTLANPPANFYRTAADMNECVETISQVFLGARLQCAKCHNHPFERWTQDNYYGLGAFFDRVQRRKTQRPGEVFIWTKDTGEVTQPRTGEKMKPWLPQHGEMDVDEQVDRREIFARWLVDPSNPYFAAMEANRIWSQLFTRGIVDPIDDFRDSNPPSNGPLLDALAADFIQSGFDRKHLLRTILRSRTYQASSQTGPLNQEDSSYFSHQRPRLLSAEQLLDAVNHITGVTQSLGGLPAGTKATQLPAPDLVNVDFLKVFGQPERTTVCACERADNSNLGMAIELFNGTTIHEKLRDPKNRFRRALAAGKKPEDVIAELYVAAFCRPPSETELAAALAHCEQRENIADGLEDVYWALLNTDEFLFQH